MLCQAACNNKKLSVTREILRGLVRVSACVQTNLQSCQKAGSTRELQTSYLPETNAHKRDIPKSILGFFKCDLLFSFSWLTYEQLWMHPKTVQNSAPQKHVVILSSSASS